MDKETQMKIFDDTVAELKNLLYNKGKEYAASDDVLANFKRGSSLGITAKQKLGVYLEKHMAAIWSYIANGKVYSEGIDGRINDAINYLIFLKDLIYEEEHNPKFKEEQAMIRATSRLNPSKPLLAGPCPVEARYPSGGRSEKRSSNHKEFG